MYLFFDSMTETGFYTIYMITKNIYIYIYFFNDVQRD